MIVIWKSSLGKYTSSYNGIELCIEPCPKAPNRFRLLADNQPTTGTYRTPHAAMGAVERLAEKQLVQAMERQPSAQQRSVSSHVGLYVKGGTNA